MAKLAQRRARAARIKMLKVKGKELEKKLEHVTPTLFTRRLKSGKQKKLKRITPPLWSGALKSKFDEDPEDAEEQKPPASFRELMRVINNAKNQRNPYRYDSNQGDVEGAKKKLPDRIPPKGKKESDESYALRLDRCVQDEMVKTTLAKKEQTIIVDPETFKSRKKKKSLRRLAKKKAEKKQFREEKRRTGFEHLKDEVKFGEVVKAPPVLKTQPKLILRVNVPPENSKFTIDKKPLT